jgi:uncharacterized membrane protein SirB2
MMITGIASILMLVSGFGLLSKLHNNTFAPWVIVKIVCWLGISALAGIGYCKRDKAPLFMDIILALAAVALWSVYVFRLRG